MQNCAVIVIANALVLAPQMTWLASRGEVEVMGHEATCNMPCLGRHDWHANSRATNNGPVIVRQ